MGELHSMTGFGEGRAEDERARVRVSIRSVNHRFLDLQLRLPDAYRPFELELAAIFKERLRRGRVEARYRVDSLVEPELEVRVRPAIARSYLQAARELASVSTDPAGSFLSAAELLRLPEVVSAEAPEVEPAESDRELLKRATAEALAAMTASRRREGAHLETALRGHLARLAAIREELAAGADDLQQSLTETLEKRLSELVGEQGIDPGRLAQEVAILADRGDVREELDRLAAHLTTLEELLDAGGECGKRMDFLTQEILRELNTLGAKCRHSAQLERVVEAKTVCEQVREQVQNLE